VCVRPLCRVVCEVIWGVVCVLGLLVALWAQYLCLGEV